MDEEQFVNKLKKELRKHVKSYEIRQKAPLIYKVIVDESRHYNPSSPQEAKRGNLAFETDLLISKKRNKVPLVLIEVKYGDFSTHDVLTYSSKVVKHKEVYPYLRCGMVVGGISVVKNRFFTHNVGFDFAIAMKDAGTRNMQSLVKVIKGQLRDAESLLKILRTKNRAKVFNTNVVIETI